MTDVKVPTSRAQRKIRAHHADAAAALQRTPMPERAAPLDLLQATGGTAAPIGQRAPQTEGATLRRAGIVDAPTQITGWNFDWDDNIFFMPTKIHVFHRATGEVRDVSTADFALIREQIGQSGEWADFEQRPTSLADFADDPAGERNYFLEDVERAMQGAGWRGPSWPAFVRAMSRKETADKTTIITARLHSAATIHAALVAMQQKGILKHVPPLANVFPVNSPQMQATLGGTANNPSAAKAQVMCTLLESIQARPLPDDAHAVLAPDGNRRRAMHTWGFSDDDWGNYKKAVDALSAEMAKGRWPDVKITVIFTGTNHPGEKPHAVVPQPDGKTRPYRKEELSEVAAILDPKLRRRLVAAAS